MRHLTKKNLKEKILLFGGQNEHKLLTFGAFNFHFHFCNRHQSEHQHKLPIASSFGTFWGWDIIVLQLWMQWKHKSSILIFSARKNRGETPNFPRSIFMPLAQVQLFYKLFSKFSLQLHLLFLPLHA